MASLVSSRPFALRRRSVRNRTCSGMTAWAILLAAVVGVYLLDANPAEAQQNYLTFRELCC